MTLKQDKDLMINSLLARNVYLESIIFGKNSSSDRQVFETPLVFVVKESETGEILGVFLDEISALSFSEKSYFHSTCEPWSIQAAPSHPVPAVIVPSGTRVSVNSPHPVYGEIIDNDGDLSQGVEKIIYKFLPDGLPNEEESIMVIYHSEIEEVLDDKITP